jgi:RNA polymerase sigma-70 factor (ECF subfamily)
MGQQDPIPPEKSFDVLLWQARAGDRQAREELLEPWRDAMEAYAAQAIPPVLRAKADPADLVQEAFVQAFQHFDQFYGASPRELRDWLFGILRHMIAHFKRSYAAGSKRQVGGEVGLDDVEAAQRLVARGPSPLAAAVAHEDADAVRGLVARLRPEAQALVWWRFRDDLAWAEIAQRAGCSAEAARKRSESAIDAMRDAHAARGDSAGPAPQAAGLPRRCKAGDVEDRRARHASLAVEPTAVVGTMTYDAAPGPAGDCGHTAAAVPSAGALAGTTAEPEAYAGLVTVAYDTPTMARDVHRRRHGPPEPSEPHRKRGR